MAFDDLEQMIRDDLTQAGLTIAPSHLQQRSGVHVWQEEPDAVGVWVEWSEGKMLSDASLTAFRRGAMQGDDKHPSLHLSSEVSEAMRDALERILIGAGYKVERDVNEYSPYGLLVTSRAVVPHWTDPITPPLDGASGFQTGMIVRVLTGEWSGTEMTVACVHRKPDGFTPDFYHLYLPGTAERVRVAIDHVEFASDPLI